MLLSLPALGRLSQKAQRLKYSTSAVLTAGKRGNKKEAAQFEIRL